MVNLAACLIEVGKSPPRISKMPSHSPAMGSKVATTSDCLCIRWLMFCHSTTTQAAKSRVRTPATAVDLILVHFIAFNVSERSKLDEACCPNAARATDAESPTGAAEAPQAERATASALAGTTT